MRNLKNLISRIIQKYVLLCVLHVSVCCAWFGANSQNVEALSIMAKGLIDQECVILIGETRLDLLMREIPSEEQSKSGRFWSTLNLVAVYPLQVLRGPSLEEKFIWIQMDRHELKSRKRHFYHVPDLGWEGKWLLFIKPISHLPMSMSLSSSELSKKIFKVDREMPPLEFVKNFELSDWLDSANWYELAYQFSAFRLNDSIRELAQPDNLGPGTLEQLNSNLERLRKFRASQRNDAEYILDSGELQNVLSLIDLLNRKGEPSSVDSILKIQSPISQMVLKELLQSATSDLSEQFRRIKLSIPKSLEEELCKSED